MISAQMQDAINDQLNYELYSAYIYLSMSAYFSDLNLPGFANWMRVQTQEEVAHAMRFYDYLVGRGGRVVLTTIKEPQAAWDSPLAAFETALEHEQRVTARINNLVDLAMNERDHASTTALHWFVTEQVEEEANADAIIRQLKLIGEDRSALFMLDRELATRVFVPPPPA